MPAAGAVWPEVSGSPHELGKCALGPEVKRRGLPAPARLFLCHAVSMLGESAKQIQGGTVELVGSPGGGGGRPAAQTLVAILAANSLIQNLATWEENGCVFPSLHYFFGFCSLHSFIFNPTIFSPCPSDCVLQAAPAWVSPGSGGSRGACHGDRPQGPSRPAWAPPPPPPLSRLPLCPGFVCEVGMTIAATFQPTSQGCCGDTVISEIVML